MINSLKNFSDIEVGITEITVHSVSEEDVNAFGKLSGDLNPLHMDESFAAKTPFKQRVVHGMLIASLISTAHTNLTGPGFVYLGQELNFKGPVFIGDQVEIHLTVKGKKEGKSILLLETVVTNQDGNTVLQGKSALMALSKIQGGRST